MKRTAEIILTVVGMVLYGLPVLLSTILLNVKDNPEVRREIERGLQTAPNADQMGAVNMDQMMDFLGSFATFILVAALISIGLGILSIVFLKGDKKPKAAGIILIVTAVLMTFGTVGFGLFAGVAYLIAGIVALVRKSKQNTEDVQTVDV
ncbi:DUF4064 domain-containing protein [Halobacillus yeomjeoni]|uniref:DUF4064 domain-containing protein n=1 Tax=Halobacillus yeomjeoni TaxID=311194 RepID=A0A931HYG5_9BACI|nr:DUF4064 domain-containing protein [Halobacillus yeomjeoni]MBH0231666.1 DUF4064 domain-containing protein [Halobacillus yeomjeoni]